MPHNWTIIVAPIQGIADLKYNGFLDNFFTFALIDFEKYEINITANIKPNIKQN